MSWKVRVPCSMSLYTARWLLRAEDCTVLGCVEILRLVIISALPSEEGLARLKAQGMEFEPDRSYVTEKKT